MTFVRKIAKNAYEVFVRGKVQILSITSPFEDSLFNDDPIAPWTLYGNMTYPCALSGGSFIPSLEHQEALKSYLLKRNLPVWEKVYTSDLQSEEQAFFQIKHKMRTRPFFRVCFKNFLKTGAFSNFKFLF